VAYHLAAKFEVLLMNTEIAHHRDFSLSIVQHATTWQVQIIPPQESELLIPKHFEFVSLPNKEDAIAEAKRRVDELISGGG
jgi:hypothetical protein